MVPLARKRLAQWTTRKPTRKRRNPETDVGDGAEGYREVVSGQEESVNFSIILRAIPVVVLESCERYFDNVCLNMFGLAQREHIPSLRTVQHAALAHLAATAPSELGSREGCLHWWRVLLENFKLNSGSMSKDMRVLRRKDLRQLSGFDSCWGWSFFCRIHSRPCFPDLPKLSYKQLCRDMELTLMNVSAKHVFSLVEWHEHLNSPHFPGSFGTIENPTLVSVTLNDGVVGCGGGNGEAEHVPQQFHCKERFLDRCGECEQIFMLPCVMYSLLGNAGSTSLVSRYQRRWHETELENYMLE